MPSKRAIEEFLGRKHIALVGVSRNSKRFANAVYRSLRDHGYRTYPVNPKIEELEGETCYSSVADVPDPLDGVVVMVNADAAKRVVEECAARGVRRVWLHRGLGAPGASSEEAVALCREHGIEVVDGACPLMFLEPVRHIHRAHRWLTRRSLVA